MTLGTRANSTLSTACAVALLIAMAAAQVRAAQEVPDNFVMPSGPKPIASIKFEDQAGRAHSLADFKGKVVVLNIWATWCVPCRREMPTLDRLQAALGSSDFEVIPVSIDRGGIDTVRKFYADIAIHDLAKYADTSGQVLRAIGAIGLPTTLVVNRDGQEVGRIVGPAEWDSAEVIQFLRSIIARHDVADSSDQAENSHVAEKDRDARGAMQRGLQWLKTLFVK